LAVNQGVCPELHGIYTATAVAVAVAAAVAAGGGVVVVVMVVVVVVAFLASSPFCRSLLLIFTLVLVAGGRSLLVLGHCLLAVLCVPQSAGTPYVWIHLSAKACFSILSHAIDFPPKTNPIGHINVGDFSFGLDLHGCY
jgi:hypothetical protein